ncbi:MAG: FHA domain-containing protein [bacterium]
MARRCPICGAEVPEDEKVCPECGTEIEEGAVQAPAAEVEVASQPQQPAPAPAAPPSAPPSPPIAPPSAPPVAPARLLLKRAGILTGDEFPVGEKVVIGRFDEETGPVDIDLANLPEAIYISRRHAELYFDPSGQWFVKDLGSRNGTFLIPQGTGQPQKLQPDQPSPINDGDEVAFGNARFVFRVK